jgi:hypothetical protein
MINKILTKISKLRLELKDINQYEFESYDDYYNYCEKIEAQIEVLIEIKMGDIELCTNCNENTKHEKDEHSLYCTECGCVKKDYCKNCDNLTGHVIVGSDIGVAGVVTCSECEFKKEY